MKAKRRRSSAPGALTPALRSKLGAAEARMRSLETAPEIYGAIAGMFVPMHAEMCVVDAIDEGGVSRPIQIVHADPARGQFVRDLAERYPPTRQHPVYDAISSRDGVFHDVVDDATIERMAVDATHLATLRRHGPRSLIIVPLESHGHVVAAVTLAITSRSRRFTPTDYVFVCELGARISATLGALAEPARQGLRSDVAPSPAQTGAKRGSTSEGGHR